MKMNTCTKKGMSYFYVELGLQIPNTYILDITLNHNFFSYLSAFCTNTTA